MYPVNTTPRKSIHNHSNWQSQVPSEHHSTEVYTQPQ